jgi:hypothetical protein
MPKVRTIRQHDTTDGLKVRGDVYERTEVDAKHLTGRGIAEPVTVQARKPRRATKRK